MELSGGGGRERQSLKLRIKRTQAGETQVWHDEHPMVAVCFVALQELQAPYFEVQVLADDYQKWHGGRGMGWLFV